MDDFFFFIYDEESDTMVPVSVEEPDIEYSEELEFFFTDKVRKVWVKKEQQWYFSIVDVVQVLTDSADATAYWRKLKQRLKAEGNETVTNCHQLKMKASDSKMRLTDCADTTQLLRIIQSIPSKKAEPFKQWLAQVGKERLDEIADPELAIERAIQTYRTKGYSEEWISKRMQSIASRKELTDEWHRSDVTESKQYAILTNTLTKAWSGMSVRELKEHKGLHKEALRDNMTDVELALNQLAELSTTLLSKAKNPNGFKESMVIAHEGGSVAGDARLKLEEKLGSSVISSLNANNPSALTTDNK